MTTAAVKITRKGQVTIPKEIREKLKTNTIYFDVTEDAIVVRAVRDVAGSLHEYAENAGPGISVKQMKGKAWEAAVHEKTGKKTS